VSKINRRKLPAIIFKHIRAFKSESHVKPDKKVTEIKPETNAG
jgi:hypothetical protein